MNRRIWYDIGWSLKEIGTYEGYKITEYDPCFYDDRPSAKALVVGVLSHYSLYVSCLTSSKSYIIIFEQLQFPSHLKSVRYSFIIHTNLVFLVYFKQNIVWQNTPMKRSRIIFSQFILYIKRLCARGKYIHRTRDNK